LSGVRGEIEARARDQLERVLAGMDLVGREEFEAARAMAAKAREEQEKLLRRVEELETRLAALEQGRRDGRGTSTS
jgi:BMFP domain-containing protein YqiC